MPAYAIPYISVTPWFILHDDPVQNRLPVSIPRDPNSGPVCITIKWMWLYCNKRNQNQLTAEQSSAEFAAFSTTELTELFPKVLWLLKDKGITSLSSDKWYNFLTNEVLLWVKLIQKVEWHQLDLSSQQWAAAFTMGCWIPTTKQVNVSSFLLSWKWPGDQEVCKEFLLSSVICAKVICNKTCFNVLTLQLIIY